MAHLHHFYKNQNPGFFEGVGNNIKCCSGIAGAVTTIFDVGKTIYSTVGPAAAAIAAFV